jgi:bla regulator protein blaR1
MIESRACKLNFSRKLLLPAVGWLAVVAPVTMFAQAIAVSAAKKDFKEFDVASVKENKGDGPTQSNFPLGPGDAYVRNGGHFIATNTPLAVYIFFAYKVQPNQGPALGNQLPDWAHTKNYDIEAKVDGDPDKDDMRAMMRALLAERFALNIHTEMHEISVLDLVQAKPGVMGKTLKVHAADDTSCPKDVDPNVMNDKAEPSKEAADGFPVACGRIIGMKASTAGGVKLGARNLPIKPFVDGAMNFGNLGKPVVDKTGLAGKYDFTLEFARDGAMFPPGSDSTSDETEPSFLNALTAQMGLKVKTDKGQVAVLVLDHVERPSPN